MDQQISQEINFYDDEYIRLLPKNRNFLTIKELIEMKVVDECNENKINFCHLPSLYYFDYDKTGKFNQDHFIKITKLIMEREKKYKRHELNNKLQGEFDIEMLKSISSFEGEKFFVGWLISCLQIAEQENNSLKDKVFKKDFLSTQTIKLLYNVMNIKKYHNTTFEQFYELLYYSSLEMDLIDPSSELIPIEIIDFFATQYIRGFCKMILDACHDEQFELS